MSFSKKLDRLCLSVFELSENVNQIKENVDGLVSKNEQFTANFVHIDERLNDVGDRLEKIQLQIVPVNDGFSEQLIREARDQLGLDLNARLVRFKDKFLHFFTYQGHNLTSTPFNNANVNLYGTKLLDILFTREEQSRGTVESTRRGVPILDQTRIDLIKICYIRKLRSIETFNDVWPSVVRSLKQSAWIQKKH